MTARKLIKGMMLSMMAHPDYINPKMGEFRDYVSMAQDYLDEPEKEYNINVDGKLMIGIKCESKPVILGAMDGWGNPIDLEKIIIKEETRL